MRRVIQIIALILIALPVARPFGQTNTNNWRLGAVGGVQMSYNDELFQYSQYDGYQIEHTSRNFSIGLQIQRQLGKRLAIVSGINYLTKDFNGIYFCHACNIAGPIEPKKIKLRYLEVPLALRYSLTVNRLSLYGQLGFATGLETRKIRGQFISEGVVYPQEGFTRLSDYNFDANVGIGLAYQLTDLIQLETTGFYKNSLLKKSFYQQNTLGIVMGVSFQIK